MVVYYGMKLSLNDTVASLSQEMNKKVNKTGDTMTGILRFENKKEFSGIEKQEQ